jgi:hypothetical protein
MLNHLQLYSKEKKVRVSKFDILDKTERQQECHGIRFGKIDGDSRKLLIVHDGGAAWSRSKKYEGIQKEFLRNFPTTNSQILVNVKELPEVDEPGCDHGKTARREKPCCLDEYPTFRSGFWSELTHHKPRVGCVVSLATLRRAGATVTHGLSWEHTVEAFASELHLFPRLRALSQFADLFVRIESAGLIHIRNCIQFANGHPEAGCRLQGRLYFLPSSRAGQRGHVIGGNTLLINALARKIKETKGPLDCEQVRTAIEEGICHAIKLHHAGYDVGKALERTEGSPVDHGNPKWTDHWKKGCNLIDDLLERAKTSSATGDRRSEEPVSVGIPNFVLAEPLPDALRSARRWHILDETLEQAPVHRINIAVAIVHAGLKPVLNQRWNPEKAKSDSDKKLWEILTRVEYWNPRDRAPDHVTLQDRYMPAMPARSRKDLPIIKGKHENSFDLFVPLEKFGDLVAAEREQIESLCGIRNLLNVYLEDKERHDRPISIAVFASPGAGKSFAVREIQKEIQDTFGSSAFLEYNVAQFKTPDDLEKALHKVEQESKKDFPPFGSLTNSIVILINRNWDG